MRFAWTAAAIAAGLGLGVAVGQLTLPSPPTFDGAHIDAHRSLGKPIAVGNLTVWPVVTDEAADVGEFLTLEDAQRRGLASVREMGSTADVNAAAAEVNRLVVENKGDLPLLLCAGTLLAGGNQDRQLGEDVVVAAHATVPVEVFCVEHGRWTSDREGTDTASEFAAVGAVAPKSVRECAQYTKSQEGVWQNVENLPAADGDIALACAGGRTSALRMLENASDATRERRETLAAAVRSGFDVLTSQGASVVGFAYAVNGTPVAVRTFADPRLLRGHLDAFVHAMALDSEAAPAATPAATASADDVVALVRRIDAATDRSIESRASDRLVTRRAEAGFGSSLLIGTSSVVTEDWTAK